MVLVRRAGSGPLYRQWAGQRATGPADNALVGAGYFSPHNVPPLCRLGGPGGLHRGLDLLVVPWKERASSVLIMFPPCVG
jgi:hypothetical protein